MSPNRWAALWTGQAVLEAARQRRFAHRPAAVVRRAQERRVRDTVAYAFEQVPYYRETMRRLGLGPADFTCAADLGKLPVIERAQLQRDPEYFLSEEWPAETCVALHSGGSTGAPIVVFRDPPSVLKQAAHFERMRWTIGKLTGRPFRYREAAISPPDSSSRTMASALSERMKLPKDLRVKRRAFSLLREPAELLPELADFRPDVLSAYGSYLDAFFTFLRESRPRFDPPRVAFYGADAMSPAVRRWAEEELGVQFVSSYSAIEAAHIGFECERHRGYHLNIDLYPVRLRDADGGDASPGCPGEVLVSNLVARGTVLLNYRLDDVTALSEQPCPCGRSLPLSSFVERRGSTWLTLGSGARIHAQALQLSLRTELDVWRYQIAQQAPRRILVRLVARPDCEREATASRVTDRFLEVLPEGVEVSIEFVTDLPRTPSGKVQPVVALSQPAGGEA